MKLRPIAIKYLVQSMSVWWYSMKKSLLRNSMCINCKFIGIFFDQEKQCQCTWIIEKFYLQWGWTYLLWCFAAFKTLFEYSNKAKRSKPKQTNKTKWAYDTHPHKHAFNHSMANDSFIIHITSWFSIKKKTNVYYSAFSAFPVGFFIFPSSFVAVVTSNSDKISSWIHNTHNVAHPLRGIQFPLWYWHSIRSTVPNVDGCFSPLQASIACSDVNRALSIDEKISLHIPQWVTAIDSYRLQSTCLRSAFRRFFS